MKLGDAQRKPIFDAVRALRNNQRFTLAEVRLLDAAIDVATREEANEPVEEPVTGRTVSQKGIDLIHSFEACRLEAYPDPGSKDGKPWTIGWGSTGADIKRGTVWTQEQANDRFAKDLARFAAKVDAALGDAPTTQSQFDSLCSLAYNIGLAALKKSTVLRKHKVGDYAGAAAAFGMWIKNNGKVMRGLVRRRAAEAAHYLSDNDT